MKHRIALFVFVLMTSLQVFAKDLQWSTHTFFDNQIFPSYSWAVSYLGDEKINSANNLYGDQYGQLGILMQGIKRGQTIKVVIAANEIAEQSELEFEIIQSSDELFYAYPQIQYKWNILEKWKQPKPVNFKVQVYVNNKLERTELKRIIVRSINDCPFFYAMENGVVLDLNYVYLSYVNENHPLITETIIPEILQDGNIKHITGYQAVQGEDYSSVYNQVYAVWHYFNKNKFYYCDIKSNFKEGSLPHISAQYVRSFSDVYKTKQANCVDGTILFASILTRMGISSYLVTTPNHCFLAFSLDGSDDKLAFLETTLLGADADIISKEQMEVIRGIALTGKDAYYRLQLGKSTFDMYVYALLRGNQNIVDSELDFRRDNQDPFLILSEEMNFSQAFQILNHRIISVNNFRNLGLLPISL